MHAHSRWHTRMLAEDGFLIIIYIIIVIVVFTSTQSKSRYNLVVRSMTGSFVSTIVFLVIAASFASLQRAGYRITAFAYIYNAVTILVATTISTPIARTTEAQEKKEADYRSV